MPSKKYVLFIVEGKNDQIEIQAMLRAYCAMFAVKWNCSKGAPKSERAIGQ